MGINGNGFKFEKRAHPRTLLQAEGAGSVINRRVLGDGPRSFRVLAVNVSRGGVQVTLDSEIASGDLLRLVFRGAEAVHAQVNWVRRNAFRLLGSYTAGLAFRPPVQPGVETLVARAMAETAPRERAAQEVGS